MESEEMNHPSLFIPEEARALPAVADAETVERCWGKAWQEYLSDLEHMGDEDPNRVPPHEFMSKKCEI